MAEAFLFAVEELALVDSFIWPVENSKAGYLVTIPVSFVDGAIWPLLQSEALFLAIHVVASEVRAI